MTAPTYIGGGIYIGISTDTNPTGMATGSRLYHTDTGLQYIYDGAAWVLCPKEANITLQNLGGLLTVAKGGSGVGTLTGIIKGNGTSAFSAVTAPSGTIVGDTDTQTLSGKTIDAASNTFTNVGLLPSIKKQGRYLGGGSANIGYDGMWTTQATAIAVSGGGTNTVIRSSAGTAFRWTTGATINGIGGSRISAVLLTERDLNPDTTWKLILSTATTTTRCFVGYISSTSAPVSAVDPLANLSGIIFGYDSAVDGNWHIYQNDGSASSDSTTIANVAAATTSAITIRLKADNANTKFQYSYAGGALTDINTKIPIAGTGLGWTWYIEALAGSAARTLDVYYAYTTTDG